jgi:hypothetical protein
MQSRSQREQQEMDEDKRLGEILKDPAQLQSLGISPQQAQVLGRGGVRQLLSPTAVRPHPLHRPACCGSGTVWAVGPQACSLGKAL